MKSFIANLYSFSITHLFLGVFLFLGLKIMAPDDDPGGSPVYQYIFILCLVGTLVQAMFFTAICRFLLIDGMSHFVIALILELLIANSLFFLYINPIHPDSELSGSLMMNGCIVIALFITMLIREYQVENN